MERRSKVERVPGNQFTMHLGGPGIFLAGPDHVVAVSDGMKFKGVRGPGVVFTHAFEGIQEPMDLRPQLRATAVEALTKDGISLRFTTYGLFQLDAGERRPALGTPFPFRARSVFNAFHKRPMEIRRQEVDGETIEQRERRQWEDLFEIVGTHVAQDIIGEYTFDELCEPFRPDDDPRGRIAREYRKQLDRAIREYGIRVRGAGVSNLLPAERDLVLRRRVANWQAEWQRRMLEQRGEAEAEGERLMGQARAQVQAEIIERISEAIAETAPEDTESMFNTVALRFVESLNRMVAQPPIREQLPPDVVGTVDRLPHIIGGA
jgi:regulator of protease activity HflC (stomatin/prohibitin superfamily)